MGRQTHRRDEVDFRDHGKRGAKVAKHFEQQRRERSWKAARRARHQRERDE